MGWKEKREDKQVKRLQKKRFVESMESGDYMMVHKEAYAKMVREKEDLEAAVEAYQRSTERTLGAIDSLRKANEEIDSKYKALLESVKRGTASRIFGR